MKKQLGMAATPPHPESVIHAPGGRVVPLKVHRCLWSGTHPENSLPAIEECYRDVVARAEIDVHLLRDADFLVLHDATLDYSTTGTGATSDLTRDMAQTLRLRWNGHVSAERPPFFSEVVARIRDLSAPTLLELDLVSFGPLPWPRVEELARLIEPVKDRVFVNSSSWNVRRLLEVDATIPVAYDFLLDLDWVPEGDPDEAELAKLGLSRGAYGYLDAHPLARERTIPVAAYLSDRLSVLTRLVPGARELHVRLSTFERMLDDGVSAADFIHRQNMLLDVWTLDAGAPGWRQRLARVLAAGADVITTNTPRALAAHSGG